MSAHLLFQCMADPSRLAIMDAIVAGTACVRDLVDATGQSQSNVSHHLAKLRDCGLVDFERIGKENHYRVLAPVIEVLDAGRRASAALPCEAC